jgi:TetR/AcrR family transcriptional repressor of lmrAB and yxaGH operons
VTKSQAKDVMLQAAVRLFRQRGFEGVGVAELLEASGAPRGSLYFHFPGGKTQIVQEAIASAGERVIERLRLRASVSPTPEDYIDGTFHAWAQDLQKSEFRNGCLVAIAALEGASHAPEITAAAQRVFVLWEKEIADVARRWGLDDDDASSFATALMGAIEGAIVLARTRRSVQPFDDGARAMKALVSTLLPRTALAPA